MSRRGARSGTGSGVGFPAASGTSLALAVALLGGCATEGWRVPAPPPGATQGDVVRCEPVAVAASQAAERGGGVGAGMGVAVMSGNPAGIVAAPVLGLGFGIAQAVQDAAPAWRAYEAAMATCVAPEVLARTLGPDHPDVATANRAAVTLLAATGNTAWALTASDRVVAIEERALGPEHRDTVQALEDHARLLRQAGQTGAADQAQARARLVREHRWPRVQPVAVDLGAALIDRSKETEIQFVNPGSVTLVVDSVSTTDPAWSVERGSCAAPVPPGHTCALVVRVVPRVPGVEITGELVVTTTTTEELRTRLTATGRLDRPSAPLATLLDGLEIGAMILVPAGEFRMGSGPDDPGNWDETPSHPVFLDAYRIDRAPVTRWAYERFAEETSRPLPASWGSVRADAPASVVTWHDADAFCRAVGRRLPTEAEWEKAARATNGSEGVRLLPRVAEWVADWYEAGYYLRSPAQDPQGPPDGVEKVVRGWTERVTSRRSQPSAWITLGVVVSFRCAKSAP